MTLPPPTLGADPLRPPDPASLADDPILSSYAERPDEPTGEAAGIPIGPAEVTAALVGLFDLMAQIRGPHWHAEPAEFAMAAPPLARELSKPDTAVAAWLARHGDALLIVVGLGAVVVPRAIIEWRVLQLRREAEREAAAVEDAHGYRPPYPVTDAGAAGAAGGPPSGAAEPAATGGPGDRLRDAGPGEAAVGRPTDPGALAAAVGGLIGS